MYNTIDIRNNNTEIFSIDNGNTGGNYKKESSLGYTLQHLDSISVSQLDTIRIKVTNSCPFSCNFCHHEGSLKNRNLIIDEHLLRGLNRFYKEMKLTQVHLTGGEPTLYYYCLDLIRELKSIGFKVKMTTNGQFNQNFLEQLNDAGLDGINFSIHTLDPIRLCKIQKMNKDYNWGLSALNMQINNLKTANKSGLEVKVNTVVQNDSDIFDVLSIKDFCKGVGINFRMLNNLDQGLASIQMIERVIGAMGATMESINLSDKSSGCSINYVCRDRFRFKVKYIRKNTINTLCDGCKTIDVCREWFYGIRIEQVDKGASVRLCIHRQDYPAVQTFEDFFASRQFQELV